MSGAEQLSLAAVDAVELYGPPDFVDAAAAAVVRATITYIPIESLRNHAIRLLIFVEGATKKNGEKFKYFILKTKKKPLCLRDKEISAIC